MCEEYGFIAVPETVHLVKFMDEGCSIFFFVPDSYGLPGRTTTEQTYTISGLC